MVAPRLGVDASGLQALARDLKRAEAGGDKRLKEGLLRAATIVADEARSRVGWSSRIGSTIRPSATPRKATVRAGGAGAPHAVVFEGRVGGGNRRHPVFAHGDRGGWAWAEQEARPFLLPALTARVEEVADAVADGLMRIVEDAGFREGG